MHHERAAELATRVQFPEEAPAQASEIQKNIVAMQAEAQSRSKWAWLWVSAFFVMAIGSAVLFIWLSARFELVRNKSVFALLLLFVMAVAGDGAQ